jgi:DNA repair protein RecO (recombination protein O)
VPSVTTTAIVLHVQNYSESSRILRLATREAGVQSVMARGARTSQRRFGSAVDLFAEGDVQFETLPSRDLHTLVRFDVTRARTSLGSALSRFDGASALAELMLRAAGEMESPAEVFDTLQNGLDAIANDGDPTAAATGAMWRLLAVLGFLPALDRCVRCDQPVPWDQPEVAFSPEAGGVVCSACRAWVPTRRLPKSARLQLRGWLEPEALTETEAIAAQNSDPATAKAHRRLLRIFVHAHLTDGRPLRAFDAWAAA